MRGKPQSLTLKEKHRLRYEREQGLSLGELARQFAISKPTVCRVLAEMREKYGMEKLKNPRRARAHLFVRNQGGP
jgi:DNA-binding MarR family transcriptional regulator